MANNFNVYLPMDYSEVCFLVELSSNVDIGRAAAGPLGLGILAGTTVCGLDGKTTNFS
jgi:hypothetical protein